MIIMGFDGFEDDWYWFWYEEAWEGNEKVPFPTDDMGNHIDNKKRDSKPCISTEERQRDEYSKKAWDFYMDFKEASVVGGTDLMLGVRVRFEGGQEPARYRLLTKSSFLA